MKELFNERSRQTSDNDLRLAKGLGWFSIALGLAGLAAPCALARLTGVRNSRRILWQGLGLRELIAGFGILSSPRPARWLWARVAGDVMDISVVGSALNSRRSDRSRVEGSIAALSGVLLVDLFSALRLSGRGGFGLRQRGAIHVSRTITINRSPEEVYQFWRNFENLPRFMKYLESVTTSGDRRSHWVAKGPAGVTVEWDAEILEDRSNELISWRSLPGSDVETSGSVHFKPAPGNRGTLVKVEMDYLPPAGRLGAKVAKMLGRDPGHEMQMDIYRFKQVMETGQVTTTDGQPAGRSTSTSLIYDEPFR
ncbi:SRPBCC family protein [Verrucomicrobiota bacterium sgz303538]